MTTKPYTYESVSELADCLNGPNDKELTKERAIEVVDEAAAALRAFAELLKMDDKMVDRAINVWFEHPAGYIEGNLPSHKVRMRAALLAAQQTPTAEEKK